MNRQRRLIQVPLAAGAVLISVAGLAGCSAGGGGATPEDADSISVAVLTSPAFNDCLADAASSFEEETGTAVELTELPYASMFDKYQTSFSAGSSAFDLINIAFQWTGQFAEQGGITPIDVGNDLDGVLPTLQEQYQYNGEQYAVPYLSSTVGYFYRTDVLEELGVTEFPDNIEDLLALIERVAADPAVTSQGLSAVSVMADKTQGMANFNGLYHAFGGGDFEKEDGSANELDTEAAAKALDAFKRMVELSPAGALTATFATTPAQFTGGTVVIEPQFNTAFGASLEAEDSQVVGKYALAPAPGGGDLGGWGFAVTEASEKKEAAQQFATYLASEEVDLKCSIDFGKSPVHEANFENEEALAVKPYLPQVAANLAIGNRRFTGPNAGALNDSVDSITSQYVSGQIPTAEEAAEQMAQAIADAG